MEKTSPHQPGNKIRETDGRINVGLEIMNCS